eukprot:13267198-Alexandrium_andersonii.AAC.1
MVLDVGAGGSGSTMKSDVGQACFRSETLLRYVSAARASEKFHGEADGALQPLKRNPARLGCVGVNTMSTCASFSG